MGFGGRGEWEVVVFWSGVGLFTFLVLRVEEREGGSEGRRNTTRREGVEERKLTLTINLSNSSALTSFSSSSSSSSSPPTISIGFTASESRSISSSSLFNSPFGFTPPLPSPGPPPPGSMTASLSRIEASSGGCCGASGKRDLRTSRTASMRACWLTAERLATSRSMTSSMGSWETLYMELTCG